MMVMHFLEWFDTCPAWQAVGVSLAGIAVIMAVEKLLARLLRPAPAAGAPRQARLQAPEPDFGAAAAAYDDTVPAT